MADEDETVSPQQALTNCLAQSGMLGKLRAQVRHLAATAIRREQPEVFKEESASLAKLKADNAGMLSLLLVDDLLKCTGLKFSQGIFTEEASVACTDDMREELGSSLDLAADGASGRVPLLLSLVERYLAGAPQDGGRHTGEGHAADSYVPPTARHAHTLDDVEWGDSNVYTRADPSHPEFNLSKGGEDEEDDTYRDVLKTRQTGGGSSLHADPGSAVETSATATPVDSQPPQTARNVAAPVPSAVEDDNADDSSDDSDSDVYFSDVSATEDLLMELNDPKITKVQLQSESTTRTTAPEPAAPLSQGRMGGPADDDDSEGDDDYSDDEDAF